jgi:hypothetical protein
MHWGKIGITSGCFVSSADIKIPGNRIKVAGSGLFEYTASTSIVGEVDRYDATTDTLYIILY